MALLDDISEQLQKGKKKKVVEFCQQALDEGIPAGEILNNGLLAGMDIVGAKFKANEIFVPQVLVAARAMNAGAELLKPHLQAGEAINAGKICMGTVKGDLHDIGKNLVKMMLEGKGLEVIDLGTDVAPEVFVETAKKAGCHILACSSLLTTTMDVMAEVVKAVEDAGIHDQVKIIVGGAPVDEEFCRRIGADAYAPDAASAADKAIELCRNA